MSLIQRENIEWKDIVGAKSRYEVSNYGDIHRKTFSILLHSGGRVLYPEKWFPFESHQTTSNGYAKKAVGIKEYYIHRLVAIAFLNVPETRTGVNHKDGNKLNNYIGTKGAGYMDGNLEWVSRLENCRHASERGLINITSEARKEACKRNQRKAAVKQQRPILQLDKAGVLINEFSSVKEAANYINGIATGISAAAHNSASHKSYKGYQWVFKSQCDPNCLYAYHSTQLTHTKKAVVQYNLSGECIQVFSSLSEAAASLGTKRGARYIKECCINERSTYKKYCWQFKN